MLRNHWIRIPDTRLIYRVRHRIMEGDCQAEHGPIFMRLPAFEILKYPVTNAQYLSFVDATGYAPRERGNFLSHLAGGLRGLENRPVVLVDLDDARAYAAFLGGRLPTEAEWYAAAGGADGRAWPWGDAFDSSRCNGDGGQLTDVDAHPAGASPFGVEDMVGNAWEWVGGEADDGAHRFALLRGGSCYRAAHFWHMQGGQQPIDSHMKMPLMDGNLNRAATVGFRVAREVLV